jgi:hypothetical protein
VYSTSNSEISGQRDQKQGEAEGKAEEAAEQVLVHVTICICNQRAVEQAHQLISQIVNGISTIDGFIIYFHAYVLSPFPCLFPLLCPSI